MSHCTCGAAREDDKELQEAFSREADLADRLNAACEKAMADNKRILRLLLQLEVADSDGETNSMSDEQLTEMSG